MTEWQPIDETTPKDRTIILFRPTAPIPIRVAPGRYDDNKYAKEPKPYWSIQLAYYNVKSSSRYHEPTLWCDFPSEPITTP
jgi:hypothetical protein